MIARSKGYVIVALLAAPAVGLAQEATKNSLDEIVITVTCMQTMARDTARSLSVVGQERIQYG
jgi:outer membrane receptor for ferrienterochelin and colicin